MVKILKTPGDGSKQLNLIRPLLLIATSFTVKDIVKFLELLDNEDLIADKYKGKNSQYAVRINCPIMGRFYDKEFLLIFFLNHDKRNHIYTITLIPGWKK